jgi:hypothetical protein
MLFDISLVSKNLSANIDTAFIAFANIIPARGIITRGSYQGDGDITPKITITSVIIPANVIEINDFKYKFFVFFLIGLKEIIEAKKSIITNIETTMYGDFVVNIKTSK